MNKGLEQREKEGKIIKCGIVGAGQMGRDIVTQMMPMRGIALVVAFDISLELAVHAFKYAGVKDADIVHTNKIVEADKTMDEGKYVTVTNSNLVSQCRPVEVAIDTAGIPDVGVEAATDAINNEKHVVMLNVEADVVVGPLLDKTTRDNGAVYTGSTGDEPGAVMELYDFATAVGLEVKVMGKGKNSRIGKNYNPDTVLEEATRREMSPKMLYALKGGTGTAAETIAMSNATGLAPDIIGEYGIASDVKSLNETYKLREDGGILKQYGVVGYVNGIAPGVFVIAATDNEEITYRIQYHSMGPGSLWTLYRPYRLRNLETSLTAAEVVTDKGPTTAPKNDLVSEYTTVARIDLKAGQIIDDIGGYTTYDSICRHEEIEEKDYVPCGLANHKAVMKCDVKKDKLITYDDTELDTTTLIYKLHQEQDKTFG